VLVANCGDVAGAASLDAVPALALVGARGAGDDACARPATRPTAANPSTSANAEIRLFISPSIWLLTGRGSSPVPGGSQGLLPRSSSGGRHPRRPPSAWVAAR